MKKLKFLSKKSYSEDRKELKAELQKGKKSHIPFRLNLLFFIIFLLFLALIARLGILQILESKNYEEKSLSSNQHIVQVSSPRGEIYDAKGVKLVGNVLKPAIVYTRGHAVSAGELRKTALKLVDLFSTTSPISLEENLTERDQKDFWLADKNHLDYARDQVSDTDKYDKKGEPISEPELYRKIVEKVKPENLQFSEKEQTAAKLFKRMNGASEFATVVLTDENISDEVIAVVGEHEADFPGISTSTNWGREYNEDSSIRDILGQISTEKAGLPAEKEKEYLAKGYSRNDRVGIAYLEEQYESVLKGRKEKTEVRLNQDGQISSRKLLQSGKKGTDLKTTIDLEFQKRVEGIVAEEFATLRSSIGTDASEAYVVAMDPRTGAIRAMAGVHQNKETGEAEKNIVGTLTNAFTPGSIVKGATISAGYEFNVLSGEAQKQDIPIQLKGTAAKKSIFYDLGYRNRNLTVPLALENSSNSYMMQIVFDMLGAQYTPNMPFPSENKDKVYQELRSAFHQYGLGVKTGIDLPNESKGIEGSTKAADAGGKLLDLSFGQYDNYTALQLAQYAATVANGGNRLEPHIVEAICENGQVKKAIEPKVLNHVNISEEQMGMIRQGFYDVVHGHSFYTTGKPLQNCKIKEVSAKTGTAEVPSGVNMSVAAFAPSQQPEIALAVMVPGVRFLEHSYYYHPNLEIAKKVLDAYHEMYMSGR